MNPIVIIDPGHGGKDAGGGSNTYWKEKDLNLKISLYQFSRYKQLGIPVAITRTGDQTLSANQRTKIVRNSGAKFCHSNHINAGGGDGGEVIHSIYGGKNMAESIATYLREAGQNIRRVFTRTLPSDSRLDYYYMNRETGKVNTVIIEYGFADSRNDDVQQLRTDWQKLAEAVVKAFCHYSGHRYHKPSVEGLAETEFRKIQQHDNKYLHLPSDAQSWRVYPLNKAPIKGNEKGFLRPSKFGGLTYELLGKAQEHVYFIQTSDFGKVQIYTHPKTGATFSK